MSQVQKSKFVYKEAPANSNLLENMDNKDVNFNKVKPSPNAKAKSSVKIKTAKLEFEDWKVLPGY